ncbi:MAG TPA: NAD(P)-dependent oxidoreductase [Chloroflexota bacterium]|nr:NAD(P)-dependent oxidoreductase [Chloroflexota bacterium]
MRRVLITGGAGGVGRELTAALVQKGYTVRAFDLPFVDFSALEDMDGVEIAKGDITDLDTVRAAVEGVDLVHHVAALLPPASERNREKTLAVNVQGTANIVRAIQEQEDRARLIFTSTVATYGDTTADQPPIRVNHPQRPNTIYSESKVLAEKEILDAAIPFTILRVSAIVMPALMDPPEWPFLANQRMEFINRADVVRALIASVEQEKAANKIFNIAGGRSWQMLGREYIEKTFPILGIRVEEAVYPEKPHYSDWYDTAEAEAVLHYQHTPFPRFLEMLEIAVAEALA